MSLDRSLKTSGGLIKHRNVLSRAERIVKLTDQGKFDPEKDSPLHLPKVASQFPEIFRYTRVGPSVAPIQSVPPAKRPGKSCIK